VRETSGEAPQEGEAASRWRLTHARAALLLVLFTLLFYGRITRHLSGDRIPSDMEDGASVLWNLWYFPHRLFHGQNPFYAPDIFYPVGAPLGFHTYTPILGLLVWPVTLLFGLPTAYVVVTLAGPALSGIGAYVLAHHVTRERWASLFAGAAYVMLPDRVLRMGGHANLNHTEMLPFALWALLRFYEEPSRRNTLTLGALLGASLWVEPIFTGFLVVAAAVVVAVHWRRTFTRPYVVAWGQAAALAGLVGLPILVAMAAQVMAGELDPLPGWGAADVTSADLLSYVVPSAFNPVWAGTFLAEAYSRWTAGERFAFAGWTLLAFAITAAITWTSSHKRTLLALAAVFAVLSLGPFLRVAGHQGSLFGFLGVRFAVPLPYMALHFVPILNGLRIPGRFALMTDLVFAVVAAGGLKWLTGRLATPRRCWVAPALALCATGLLAIECLPGSVPVLHDALIPGPYDAIAADPGHRAVLELPLQWRDGFGSLGDAGRDDTVFMYYATHHGKPLSGGMVARYPDAREARLREIPVYRQILSLQGDAEPARATFTAQDLRDLDIGYVVAHRDRPVPRAYDYVESLDLPVLADDGTTVVWRVPA